MSEPTPIEEAALEWLRRRDELRERWSGWQELPRRTMVPEVSAAYHGWEEAERALIALLRDVGGA